MGVCGTDISGYLGKMPFFSYPRIPGHELGVEVVEVGGGVTNVKAGDRCSVEPYINDPNSYSSRKGRPNCCEKSSRCWVFIATAACGRTLSCPPANCMFPPSWVSSDWASVETLAIGQASGCPQRLDRG